MTIQFKRIGIHELPIPNRATDFSAGLDLRAAVDMQVPAGGFAMIPTGFAVGLNQWRVGLVCPRSGLAAKHGITVLNAPGVIDADYRGEICVLLHNTTDRDFQVVAGDRIAQLVVTDYFGVSPVEVDNLPETDRGQGGFGSTGR